MEMIIEHFKTIFDRPEKIKKLRENILNLAIRGKLVPEDSTDEPASILLEKIKEEKEKLITEKRINKIKKNTLEYKQNLNIPKTWAKTILSDLCYIADGVKTHNLELPYLEAKYLRGKIEGKIKNSGKIVKKNTYLLLMDGENSGEVFITKEDGYLGSTFKVLIINKFLNEKFINYLLLNYKNYFKESKKGAAIPHLNRELFNYLEVGLPSLKEQNRIVKKVELLMDICDKLEESLEKKIHYSMLSAKSVFNTIEMSFTAEELEQTLKFIIKNFKELSLGDNAIKELKNYILKLAVQGKLVPQNSTDEPASILLEKIKEQKEKLITEKIIKREKSLSKMIDEKIMFEIPKGWFFSKLGEISYIGTGATPLKSNIDFYKNGNIPWITSSATNREYIYNSEQFITKKAINQCKLNINPVGTLIVAMYGQGKTRGQVSELMIESTTNQACATVNLYNSQMKDYTKLFLKKIYSEIRELAAGGAQPNLNLSKIKNYLIPIPPLNEQIRIVKRVNEFMKLCDILEEKINASKKYNESLMKSIVNGVYNV